MAPVLVIRYAPAVGPSSEAVANWAVMVTMGSGAGSLSTMVMLALLGEPMV